jgi:two-component system response regulator DctR
LLVIETHQPAKPSEVTMNSAPVVYVVDDDNAVRAGLEWLFASIGVKVLGYATAEAFLDNYAGDRPSCAFIDVRMQGISGLDLLDRIVAADFPVAAIMLSGHGDIPMAISAIKKGALDFVPKPGHEQQILDLAQRALQASARCIEYREQRADAFRRVSNLSSRELETMRLVASGHLNKEIAASLSISERTVESHRLSAHRKLQLRAGAELARIMALYGDQVAGHCRGAMGAMCPRCRTASLRGEIARAHETES